MHNAIEAVAKDRNILRALARDGEQRWHRLLGHTAKTEKRDGANPPPNFHFPYMVGRPTPYECCDADGRVQHAAGGVLRTNQVVWLEHALNNDKLVGNVTAFSPSSGLIRLNTRGLLVVQAKHAETP